MVLLFFSVFNFTTGRHDVSTISKRDFDDFNDDNTMDLITTSPAKFTLNRTGEYYFTCTFPTHCSKGQKLSIKVSGSSPAPTEAPSSPPEGSVPSSPSGSEPLLPSSTIAPPPEGSAMSVDATFSVIIMTTAMNLLFQF
ncbi:cucumber peeling cupredoxin-like [Quillaja saponaria]|uniref:Cucumber peeling cupredoxin-like n=1 Tax=Quillaja saponaria TaxID=32244 RepID=A0AAD7PJ72_QUISA|nr:cucumber peeling cupredoxin-like [Quillaja saponaria]